MVYTIRKSSFAWISMFSMTMPFAWVLINLMAKWTKIKMFKILCKSYSVILGSSYHGHFYFGEDFMQQHDCWAVCRWICKLQDFFYLLYLETWCTKLLNTYEGGWSLIWMLVTWRMLIKNIYKMLWFLLDGVLFQFLLQVYVSI